MSPDKDTIKIKEVIISRSRINSIPAGYKKIMIDSAVIADHSNSNLSEMLSGKSIIFIKSYGIGGVASPSFRGTGANQTVIDWNGININNPMLGQSDISLIPVGLIDDIHVYFGGASMMLNNGGIGGAINLESKPSWENGTLVTLNSGIGSFGEYSGLIKVKTGNTQFQSVTKGFLQSAENNFRYLDNENSIPPVWRTRTNSQSNQQGFIQELYCRNTDNVASARVWYQSSDKHLPPNILSSDDNEKQFDESLRIMLNDCLSREKGTYSFTGAWLLGRLNYTSHQGQFSIDSRSLSETYIMKAERESHPWKYTNLKISLNNEFCVVKSTDYNQKVNRNSGTGTASLERECIDRYGITILLSEILINHSFLIPDFSAGFQYRIIENRDYFMKASISRNSGIPTMNDLYYPNSGNPDLKNEYAFNYEMTYEMNQKVSSSLNIKADVSVFRISIKDMIQWHAVNSDYWIPDNINRVTSTGLESAISVVYSVNKLIARLDAGYSLTKAVTVVSHIQNDDTAGKQLMYIPVNQGYTSVRISFRNLYSLWGTSLTGMRYTTNADLNYLPFYTINNTITGIKLPLRSASIDISLNINNLFAINYQSIAHYPMPGRSYFMKILVQIIK
jgi:vitamin B12 transporter